MNKFRINWDSFTKNSSTADAILEVALGEINTFKAWQSSCWPLECKEEIKRIKRARVPFHVVRTRALRFCKQNYSW